MTSKFGWVITLGLAMAAGALVLARWRDVGVLRAEVAGRQSAVARLEDLRRENEQRRVRATQAPSVAADEAAIAKAQAELKPLEARLARVSGMNLGAGDKAGAERFAAGRKVPVKDCRQAGYATPQAAFETALWAAAGGDVDAFARSIFFVDDRTRKAAADLLASLPFDAQQRYQTPERLVAELTIPNVPLGQFEVNGWGEAKDLTITTVAGRFWSAEGEASGKTTVVPFRRQGDEWKVMVLPQVVAHFAAQLQGGATK
ncbi:hypothetical protein [Opitutus sp. ER46]|uniref:hypothetical protein n=1 Tax=Opitutus sp. ER46 TaxID=2161864 RepID=UPI000D30EF5D|nr:hypothetical protein [Opitutus sp. ER46]PTX91789.1 hypothetical protein DB354_18200 [Opitutus sp. ER46]